MPNWIVNVVNVYGKNMESNEEVISFLKQHLKDNEFDFNTILESWDVQKEYKNEDVDLNWRVRNWGVKWNSLGNQYFDYEKIRNGPTGVSGKISLVFETAWEPPLPLIKELILKHPELEITWDYYSFESMKFGTCSLDDVSKEVYNDHFEFQNYDRRL